MGEWLDYTREIHGILGPLASDLVAARVCRGRR